MKIKNVEIGGYIQSKKDSKQLIAGHCYQVAEKDVSDKTVRLFSVDASFDDSLWFCVSDFRKPRPQPQPKPQLRQLDQSVFNGLDEKWKSAATNTDGKAYLHNMPKSMMYFNHSSYGWCSKDYDAHEMQLIGDGFDPSGFAVGFIERDTAKELLEVDLSSELTGSELCRAMINKNDWVLAYVSDENDATAEFHQRPVVVTGATADGRFKCGEITWRYAVPINNQGEPLTAAEAGL